MADTSRVIAAEDVDACEPWALPSMSLDDAASVSAGHAPLTAGQLEKLQRQAFEEAFGEGREAGYRVGHERGAEAAQAELGPLVEQCRGMLDLLAEPFDAVDEALEEMLLATVFAVARQLVRREIQTEPGEVVGAVREALKVLPPVARLVRIHLHPADAPIVRDALGVAAGAENAWTLVDDPAISRGGCRIETEHSRVDATVEGRLAAAVAGVLGGQREADAGD